MLIHTISNSHAPQIYLVIALIARLRHGFISAHRSAAHRSRSGGVQGLCQLSSAPSADKTTSLWATNLTQPSVTMCMTSESKDGAKLTYSMPQLEIYCLPYQQHSGLPNREWTKVRRYTCSTFCRRELDTDLADRYHASVLTYRQFRD